MALHGKIIRLNNDAFGFESISNFMNEPKASRHVWGIGAAKTSGYSYCRTDEAIGKDATCSNGIVSCYLGNGNHFQGALTDQTAITTETLEIPAPKVRKGVLTRYYFGNWQKFTKAKRWVTA
jgi:hypothetical protein